MRQQMHRRGPAAGDADAVAGQVALGADVAVERRAADLQALDAAAALGLDRDITGVDLDPGGGGGGGQFRRGDLAGIQQRGGDPGPGQRDGIAVGAVAIAGDHRAPPRRDAEAVDISCHRARQHHSGPVVVAEGDGAFDGAGGEHDPGRADDAQIGPRHAGSAPGMWSVSRS